MNLFHSSRPALFLAATVLACGASGCSAASDPGVESSAPASPPPAEATSADAPSAEPSGPEAPGSAGDQGVAIAIPQLPIGGNAGPDGPGNQCATAGWLQPEVLPDSGVTVTGAWIEPPEGFRIGGSCGGVPGCASFTFRSGGDTCSVAVEGSGNPREPQLKLKGEVTCARGRESTCQEVRALVRPGVVPLGQPDDGTTQPESSTTEPPPSPAGSSPSPAG